MRLIIARCTVHYTGRLESHLPSSVRLIMVKADGCVAIHADGGAYKPLNWMNAPNRLTINQPPLSSQTEPSVPQSPPNLQPPPGSEIEPSERTSSETEPSEQTPLTQQPSRQEWRVASQNSRDILTIKIEEILHDHTHDMGIDPGLQKDGMEVQMQELLAADTTVISAGLTLIRREYPTAIGPVDMLCRDAEGTATAIEVKRNGEIDGVEQLTRYLEFLNRDPRLRPVRGVLVAQTFKRQARTLAISRSIDCVEVDYDSLRGAQPTQARLF